MSIISDPYFYLVAVPAILIFGMSKGGFGGGVASISVPMMALVVDPLVAAAVFLPILIAMDAVAVWKFRHSWSARHLQIMLPAALLGIVIASLLMGVLSTNWLRVIIGAIAIGFCLQHWLSPLIRPAARPHKPGALAGSLWGFTAGFTSTQIHAGGIPASVYLLPQGMSKWQLMGTSSLFFAVVNALKLVPYSLLGQFDSTNLNTSLVLLPLAPVGVLLGYTLLGKVNEGAIYRILYFFLFFAGAKLIWDGLV